MPRRQRVPLVFGRGLDRETGAMATRPGSMEDLRNVYHRRGKVTVRKGNVPRLEFVDENGSPMTVVLAGHMLLGERTGVVVAYQGNAAEAAYGDVDIYLLDASATVQRRIGNWFNTQDLGLDPTEPPIVSVTDHYNRAFFAHNEYAITKRAPTFVYDPFTGPELEALTVGEDWSRYDSMTDDERKLRFRGVESYLDYLVGWGYGSPFENRAELVRLSIPGDPRTFREEHYVLAGARKDPTICCREAGNELAIFKEVETYRLVGHDRYSFGVKPLDTRFGCVAARLAVSVEGTCFFWSTHGPRYTEGGPSINNSNSLELDASEPASLPDAADLTDGWANYIAEQRVVVFAFNRRLYVLSLHDIQNPRWSYWELGFDQFCGFQLYVTGVGTAANTQPTGHAEWEREFAPNDFESNDPPDGGFKIGWDNVGQDGDETVEVWGQRGINLVGADWRMEDDGDSDGVVDGFTSDDSNATASYDSLETDGSGPLPGAQRIEVTASTAAGHALVEKTIEGITAGNVYTFGVEHRLDAATGGAHPEVEIEWQDGGSSTLSTETVDVTPATSEFERRFLYDRTAPVNAAQVVVRLKLAITASGETGTLYWRLLSVLDNADLEGWERLTAIPVATSTDQTTEITAPSTGFYQTALRYRRSVFFAAGYSGSDPDAWPDEAKGVAVASSTGDPEILDYYWEASTDESGTLQEHFVVVASRDFDATVELVAEPESGFPESNPILSDPAPHLSGFYRGLIREGPLGSVTLQDYELTIRLVEDGIPTGAEDSVDDAWPGPTDHPQNVLGWNNASGEYKIQWQWGLRSGFLGGAARYTPYTRIEENINSGGWNTADSGGGLISNTSTTEYNRTGLNPGDTVELRISHEVAFGNFFFRSKIVPTFGDISFTV